MNESHRQPVEYHWYQYATARQGDAVWREREPDKANETTRRSIPTIEAKLPTIGKQHEWGTARPLTDELAAAR